MDWTHQASSEGRRGGALRQSLKLWVRAGASEDLGVPGRDDAATLTLESLRYD